MLKIIEDILGTYGICTAVVLCFTFLKNRKIFGYCILLLLLTVIYNTVLKNIFKLPLPQTCPSTGYGFPSGHTHFVAIFYIWVMYHYFNRRVLVVICAILLLLTGWLIVCCGYHYPIDVVSAIGFATISVFLYAKFIEKTKGSLQLISIYTVLIALIMCVILKIIAGNIAQHVCVAMYSLIGFAAFWNAFSVRRSLL